MSHQDMKDVSGILLKELVFIAIIFSIIFGLSTLVSS